MKATLFTLLALFALAASRRDLKQLDIDFAVCRGLVRRNCCENFDFGNITQLYGGKQWPENSECEFTVTDAVPVDVRPLDQPLIKNLKNKNAVKEYVAIEPVETSVNIVITKEFVLLKYAPPNNVWGLDDDEDENEICVCPTPGAASAAAATTTATVTAIPDNDREAPRLATAAAVANNLPGQVVGVDAGVIPVGVGRPLKESNVPARP